MVEIIIYSVLAYLIGSIPFGLILTKVFLKQDVRKIGSGNIGATNVARTGKKWLAALTLFLDMLKGFIAVIIIGYMATTFHENCPWVDCAAPSGCPCYEFLSKPYLLTFGIFAILGHCFPPWLKFKGGKGVATTLGVLFAATPITGFAVVISWILSFMAGKISALAAITGMIVAPAITYTFYGLHAAIINIIISLLVIARHHQNIRRMLSGQENSFKK